MSNPWTAHFISAPTSLLDGAAPYFRKPFAVKEKPVSATLYVTALGIVYPHLNGKLVGNEVLTPGWTSYRNRLLVTKHDVTDLIDAGDNVVGSIVGDGWAVGYLGWEGQKEIYSDRPALYLQLDLEYADGSKESIGTDTSWKYSSGAVQENDLYNGETYDSRLEPTGWDTASFDHSGWKLAQLFDWDVDTLELQTSEPIRRTEVLQPKEILMSPSGKTIIDFGQNISGWVRIHVQGAAGDIVTLRHAELLTPDGELEPRTLRKAKSIDHYILSGEGIETWEPQFTFHGFRYAEIDGWPGDLTKEDVQAIVIHTDMKRIGWFETSNPLLNRLHENALWGMRGNFVGLPTDCPQRDERLGWTGDINAFGPTAAFLYDVQPLLKSWLQDVAVEQQVEGSVPQYVPSLSSYPSPPTALWGDVVISLPWALYQAYGDKSILENTYSSMTMYMDDVAGRLDENDLWSSGFQYGDWLDPDAPEDNAAGGKTDAHLVGAAFLAKTSKELSQIAALLGRAEDRAKYDDLAKRTRHAFRREYVSEAGRVVNETATAYSLAIEFGLFDEAQLEHAGNRLAEIVRGADYRISTGFAGTPYAAPALARTGHIEDAYSLLLQTESPSFLYPVLHGATTIWERYDAVRADGTLHPSSMTSLNHYALGAICSWMHEAIGGLTPLEPGYSRMLIAPKPGGGLTSAKLCREIAGGTVKISWQIEGSQAKMEVDIPKGAAAQVELPCHPDGLIEEVSSGHYHWEYEIPVVVHVNTLDTPIAQLRKQPKVWKAILAVFARKMPGIPMDRAETGNTFALRDVFAVLPSADEDFKSELITALEQPCVV